MDGIYSFFILGTYTIVILYPILSSIIFQISRNDFIGNIIAFISLFTYAVFCTTMLLLDLHESFLFIQIISMYSTFLSIVYSVLFIQFHKSFYIMGISLFIHVIVLWLIDTSDNYHSIFDLFKLYGDEDLSLRIPLMIFVMSSAVCSLVFHTELCYRLLKKEIREDTLKGRIVVSKKLYLSLFLIGMFFSIIYFSQIDVSSFTSLFVRRLDKMIEIMTFVLSVSIIPLVMDFLKKNHD